MKTVSALALIGFFTLAACGQRTDYAPVPSDDKVNADSSMSKSTSDTAVGRADAEDPATGTNTARPDSPKDLKPGTDGNTNPPTP